MSYILDALRRAEADRERERGQVPGLHTPPQPDAGAAATAGPRRWLPWAGGGLLLLAGLGAGSWWAGTSTGISTGASATPPAQPAPPAAPPLTPAPALTAASLPAPTPVVASAPVYLPSLPPPPPVAATRPEAVAAEARVPRLAELPEALRRELPPLAISGSVYSEDPTARFVMINGEAVREGARLGAELVLERIGPRELVLRFKGQRFRQPV